MMVWTLISMLVLTVLIPGDGQTVSWKKEALQGQMFSVMSGEVRFRSDKVSTVTGLTICMRVLTYEYFEFGLTFRNSSDRIFYRAPFSSSEHYFILKGVSVSFERSWMTPTFEQLWPWRNWCFTWQSSTGMAQLWLDGKMRPRKGVARGQVLSGQAELTISQFRGQLADVYVWDSALTIRDLYGYLSLNSSFPSRPILDWQLIQYSTSGYAVLEPTYIRPF